MQKASAFLKHYYTYVFCLNFYTWLPIFFLFFDSRVSTAQVLQLEAIYYASVVLAEVPFGYLSDKIGRLQTLTLAMASFICAYTLFFLSDSFGSLALAQVLLGFAFALNSGTDTSLLYETLVHLNKDDPGYAQAEAQSTRLSMLSTGLAVIVGSSLATFDLALPYLIAGGLSIIGIIATFRMRHFVPKHEKPSNISQQLRSVFHQAKEPGMIPLALFVIFMTAINHIPYEFAQPYIRIWTENTASPFSASTYTGAVTALSLFAGALAAPRLITYMRSLPMPVASMAILLLSLALITWLAKGVGIIGIMLLCLRTIPASLSRALGNIWTTPRLRPQLRATYLSIQSLCGRLSFSGLLLYLSSFITTNHMQQKELATVLSVASSITFIMVTIYGFALWRSRQTKPESPAL